MLYFHDLTGDKHIQLDTGINGEDANNYKYSIFDIQGKNYIAVTQCAGYTESESDSKTETTFCELDAENKTLKQIYKADFFIGDGIQIYENKLVSWFEDSTKKEVTFKIFDFETGKLGEEQIIDCSEWY